MRREIETVKRRRDISGCCPGHDDYPVESYKNRRSKAARAEGIKKEHRAFRRVSRLLTNREACEELSFA